MTTQLTQAHTDAVDRLLTIRDEMASRFIDRDAEIEGLCLALVIQKHILLLGPPGTAKSLLATTFGKAINARSTYTEQFNAFMAPESIFGPYNPKMLLEGKYIRCVEGYLPTAEFAYLDEVFNANQGILTTMNQVLNEREFKQGTQTLSCPLKLAVGAANVYPEGDLALAALYDRFVLRYWTDYLGDRDHKMQLLKLDRAPGCDARLQDGDLDLIREAAKLVAVPDDVLEAMIDVEEKLAAQGMEVSDRRSLIQKSLVQAHALLNGRSVATLADVFVLANSVWDKHEDRPAAWKAIATVCDAPLLSARTLFDAFVAEVEDVDLDNADAASDINRPLKSARAALNKSLAKTVTEIKSLKGIDIASDEVAKLLAKLQTIRTRIGRAIAKHDWKIDVARSA